MIIVTNLFLHTKPHTFMRGSGARIGCRKILPYISLRGALRGGLIDGERQPSPLGFDSAPIVRPPEEPVDHSVRLSSASEIVLFLSMPRCHAHRVPKWLPLQRWRSELLWWRGSRSPRTRCPSRRPSASGRRRRMRTPGQTVERSECGLHGLAVTPALYRIPQ